MKAGDILKIALVNTTRARRRSSLTALAVAIGVASVIMVTAAGDGGREAVKTELSRIGIKGLTVYLEDGASGSGEIAPEDAAFIEKRVQNVQNAMPYVLEYGSYRIKGVNGTAVVIGVGDKLCETLDIELKYGRVPNAVDVKYGNNVAVVDDELAQSLYKRDNIVGKEIKITLGSYSEVFTIVGVISSQKSTINSIVGGNIPDFIYVPYTTANRMKSGEGVDQIAVRCFSDVNYEKTGEEIEALLNQYRSEEGVFQVENISGYVDKMENVADIITLLISAIGGISLCVAGVGVMNTMLSSLAERRREIGIYLAVGAKRRDIVLCFLAEAVILCLAGGLVGALAGSGLALLAGAVLELPVRISLQYILLAETISGICGIIFGISPAIRASKLEPIDALREE